MATPNDIYNEITRIDNAKQGIAEAIEEKGVQVPAETPIQDFPEKVRQIRQGSETAVEYTPQDLSPEQQEQARTNIAAASESEVSQLRSKTLSLIPTIHSDVAKRYIEPTSGSKYGKWRSTTGGACRFYDVAGFGNIIITANSDNQTRYALLKSDTVELGETADFATGETINILAAGTTTEVSVPSDAKYLYVFNYSATAVYLPEAILKHFADYESFFDFLIVPTNERVDALYGMLAFTPSPIANDGYYIEPSGATKGNWVSLNDAKSCFYSLTNVKHIKITANSTNQCRYALLTSKSVVVGSQADFVSGTTIISESAGSVIDIDKPDTAQYLYIFQGTNNTTNYEPSSIVFTTDNVYALIKNDIFKPLDDRVQVLEGKSASNKTTLLAESDLVIPNFHFSVDDCISCFYDLVTNNRASIYDNPFFAQIKAFHDTYGVKVTLYCFLHDSDCDEDFRLSDMPNTWKTEFQAAKDWMRFAFHGEDDLTFNNRDILPYYSEFVSAIYGMTEDYGCIDTVVRTQSFTGNLANVLGLMAASHGAIAFIGGWEEGGRVSYYLNQEDSDFLVRHGVEVDNINNVLFFRSWPYLDSHELSDIQAEYYKYPVARKYVEISCHLIPTQQSIYPGAYSRAEAVCDWFINTLGYDSTFLMDILK